MQRLTLVVLIVAALGVTGCCKRFTSSSTSSSSDSSSPPVSISDLLPGRGKIAECNDLIASINKNGKVVSSALDKFGASKKSKTDSDALAKTLDAAADEVKNLDIKDPTLKTSAKEYHDMLDGLAKAARDVNSPSPAKQKKASDDLDQIVKTEDRIVDKVNTFCGATP